MLIFLNNFFKIKNIFLNIILLLYIIFLSILYAFQLIHPNGLILLIILMLMSYAFFIHLFETFSKDVDKHTKKIHQTILENIPRGIMITDYNGNIQYVNKQFETITKYSKKEVLSKNASLLKSGHHPKKFYEKLWNKLQNEGRYTGEIINRKKNGEIYPERVSITAIYNNYQIDSYIAIFSDISEEKEILQRLKDENTTYKRKAQTDYLTNLYNRNKFDNILEYEFKKYKRYKDKFCIVFVDIDFFKNINDKYGHDVGDEVLVEFSNILSNNIRQCDTAARWGGEEFIILLSNTTINEAFKTANKLKHLIEEYTFPFDLKITASMGLVEYNETYEVDTLIKAADNALYKAKEQGRNKIIIA